MVDLVRPLKLENPADGGTEFDSFPTEVNLTNDYVNSAGFAVKDGNTLIERDASNNLVFTDTVTGTKTLAELSTGGTGGSLSKLFQGIDSTGFKVTNVAQVIPFDTVSIKDDYYVHSTSTNPGEITIQNAGWYRLSVMVTIRSDSSSGGTRGNPVLNMEIDTGSGFVAQQDLMGGYIRENASQELSTSITGVGLFQFSASDKIRFTVKDTVATEPDESTKPYTGRCVIEFIDRTGAMSGVVNNLTDIGDVNAPAPSEGQVLTYDDETSKWINQDKLIVETVTTTHTADEKEVILCNATSGAFIINLPTATTNTNKQYIIKKTDTSSNKVTVDANGTETIDGQLTQDLRKYDSITIISDGIGWQIL